ncbi:MAG: hypothetical protein ACRET6_02000, partial [Burkholderiales bacterium]
DYARCRVQAPTYPFQRQRVWFEKSAREQPDVPPSPSNGIDVLVSALLDNGDAEQLSGLWGQSANHSQHEALRRQVRSLGLEQARDLLRRAVQLSQEKEELLRDRPDRVQLRRNVEQLEPAQLRELLVKAVELLWKKDGQLSAYVERKALEAEAADWDLEQTRAVLEYVSEQLRRKTYRIKGHEDGA